MLAPCRRPWRTAPLLCFKNNAKPSAWTIKIIRRPANKNHVTHKYLTSCPSKARSFPKRLVRCYKRRHSIQWPCKRLIVSVKDVVNAWKGKGEGRVNQFRFPLVTKSQPLLCGRSIWEVYSCWLCWLWKQSSLSRLWKHKLYPPPRQSIFFAWSLYNMASFMSSDKKFLRKLLAWLW